MSFVDLNQIADREVVPGFHGKFVHSEQVTVAFWDIEVGAALPEHSHVHELSRSSFSHSLFHWESSRRDSPLLWRYRDQNPLGIALHR